MNLTKFNLVLPQDFEEPNIEKMIGNGTFGIVNKSKSKRDNLFYAIKMIKLKIVLMYRYLMYITFFYNHKKIIKMPKCLINLNWLELYKLDDYLTNSKFHFSDFYLQQLLFPI